MRTVLCMKWGTLYGAEYVNVLYRAVAANLSAPFRFVCLTDDASGLAEGIEAFPIPDMGLGEGFFGAGGWPKLGVFKPELYDITGRVLFIDLDTFINGSLEPFFEATGPFLAIGGTSWTGSKPRKKPALQKFWNQQIRNRLRKAKRQRAAAKSGAQTAATEVPKVAPNRMGTGIFAYDAGSLGYIFEAFMADPAKARATYANEQHFVEMHLRDWAPWPQGLVMSYKYALRPKPLAGLFQEPAAPPPEVPVVAFHGDPRPYDLVHSRMNTRGEFPHVWFGPVSWAKAYWERYNKG